MCLQGQIQTVEEGRRNWGSRNTGEVGEREVGRESER
jgi:hypothetical protein